MGIKPSKGSEAYALKRIKKNLKNLIIYLESATIRASQ
jgi:hypothetical protein